MLVASQAYPEALGIASVQASSRAKDPDFLWTCANAQLQKSSGCPGQDEWESWEDDLAWENSKCPVVAKATEDWGDTWSPKSSPKKQAAGQKRKSGSSSSSSSSKSKSSISTSGSSSSKGPRKSKSPLQDFAWPDSEGETSSNNWAWDS